MRKKPVFHQAMKKPNPIPGDLKNVCSVCLLGPLSGRSLYRKKGALFYKGNSLKAKGPLFCAEHAPDEIVAHIKKNPWLVDRETRALLP